MTQLTLLHSERPKLYAILAFLSAIGLREGLKAEWEGKGRVAPSESVPIYMYLGFVSQNLLFFWVV